MLSPSVTAGLRLLWRIPGIISASFTAVGVDRIRANGPFRRGFESWVVHSLPQIKSGLKEWASVLGPASSLSLPRGRAPAKGYPSLATAVSESPHLFP